MNSLFGVELPTAVNFVIAFVVVLVLIGAAAWLVRRFGATRLDAAARGRQPRLAVIDSAAVDGRRKLVIIRRDNVEHLLMIGGPTDVVVETNIVRAVQAAREAAAPRNGGAEAAPRTATLPEPPSWQPQPEPAPMPAPVHNVRPERAPRVAVDDPTHWHAPLEPAPVPPPPLRAVRPADTLAGLADELSRPESPAPLRAVHPEPVHAPAPHIAPANIPQPAGGTDHSLAEMAQRLEAALRRPSAQRTTADGGIPRVTVAAEAKPAARTASAAAPKGGAQPRPQQGNLEKEMANLLGRPGKT